MNQKNFFPLAAMLLISHLGFAQFYVKDQFFETTDVSNQGAVAGYEAWAGPYSLWLPEAGPVGGIITIGGLAPGQGIGGQAKFSNDGQYLSGTSFGPNGPEMARYSVASNQWTPVGSLGFSIDNTLSGGYAIAGDGNTVVGNAWADTTGGHAFTHAVAWSPSEGLMDLGSLYADQYRSARANAVSHDGKVVVGWQDFNGPWKSAVWRKDPAGGYNNNQYILLDPNGSPTDEFNQMGECTAVSADGNWIGGYGDYANNNEPWIWSAATGVINLGSLSPGAQGYVAGISADGSLAVGRFSGGPFEPQLPFVWTPSAGIQNLNDYITNTLGIDLGSYQVYSATALSPNGRYIAGYGVDNSTFAFITYRVSLPPSVGTQEAVAEGFLKIYPNPTQDWITIENTDDAFLTITDAAGLVVTKLAINGKQNVDVAQYPAGRYFITVETAKEGNRKTALFVKH